ncbi:uncharacterized protein LOC133375059 isoform X2 [Rhineura floridana]|uniref:uncharacterized protein LOC133375059 isoform X2 n=1 Tax=Rhineura floridana TaxID=261503 RepID=UPI002AC862B8|nr:uncharacterized protein LOC133375059 isoform X2 [Rhineura floridana]
MKGQEIERRHTTAQGTRRCPFPQQVCFQVQHLKVTHEKMLFLHFIRIILFSLQTAPSQGSSEMSQKLPRILASPGDTVDISCSHLDGSSHWTVIWYKENEGKSLHKIGQSSRYSKLEGKYSSKGHKLIIRNAQRNDSGVYYCAASAGQNFRFTSRTRLIISDPSRPSLAIFTPSSLEESQHHNSLPLLCVFDSADLDWDFISWNISGEPSQDRNFVDITNEEGDVSIWSLKLIPPGPETERVSFTCSDPEKKHTSFGTAPATPAPTYSENCFPTLYFGVPCVVLLLLTSPVILLFRKRLDRGNAEKPAHQIPLGEIPETQYAELPCNK